MIGVRWKSCATREGLALPNRLNMLGHAIVLTSGIHLPIRRFRPTQPAA
ncbi:MAG: hypothetical protein U0637_15385 [Phycisphaerales bacterium]